MSDAQTIIDSLGRRAIERALGVSRKAVSKQYTANELPASWWKVLSSMAAAKGIYCPESAFNFRNGMTAVEPRNVDAATNRQPNCAEKHEDRAAS